MAQKHRGNWQARTNTIAEHKKSMELLLGRERSGSGNTEEIGGCALTLPPNTRKALSFCTCESVWGPRNTGVAARKPCEFAPSYQENADALRAPPRKPWELARPVRAKALELSATHNSHYFWRASGRGIRGHQGASGDHFARLQGHQEKSCCSQT